MKRSYPSGHEKRKRKQHACNMREQQSGEMTQQGLQVNQEKICCSICLDLLKDPVTIACGHNYCMNCIKSHWDEEDQKRVYSCPQCRQDFRPRPALVKNTMLADLVEDLKKTGLQAAPADHRYAGPQDVACDFCSGRKLKALKSCLQCLVSYCEQHLQPHYESPAFEKHKLVDPSWKLQENICTHHGKAMKIFCCTDQQCICYLCTMDQHKGHDTVSATEKLTETQKEVRVSQKKVQQRIQDREKDEHLLQQEEEAINRSADKAVNNSEKIFRDLTVLIEKMSSDVKQQIRSQQKTEKSRVKERQERLQQEMADLRRKNTELEQLLHTEDHIQFLQKSPSLSCHSEPTDIPRTNTGPLQYFDCVAAAVSEVRDKLKDIFSEKWKTISQAVAEVDVLLPQAEPKTRAEFLRYSCQVTLDPNSANTEVALSKGNKKATNMDVCQLYSSHPDRFTDTFQVLSKESLTRRCYWEVEWSGGGVSVAVTYKDINRSGDDSGFGNNVKSWALECTFNADYRSKHKSIRTSIPDPQSSRVGVYLDYRAGILSFYSVSETMTLLHRVWTTFTQPLYAGLCVHYCGSAAELC